MPMRPLAQTAFQILVDDLGRHGNVLSEMHRAALYELVDTFTDYVEGAATGRKAFGLPTGMGKTSAIAAFVAALHSLDVQVAVAVAASKVEALCNLKRDFLRLGVPASKIGLKHSLVEATEPSTGTTSFPFQLITHARVRSGKDFELFGSHEGMRRALLIHDETLFRSDVLAIESVALQSALGALKPIVEAQDNSTLALAFKYLGNCDETIQGALTGLRGQGGSTARGVEIELEAREPTEIAGYIHAIRGSRLVPNQADTLEDLLQLSQDPLRVVLTQQGGGVLWCAEVVPKELRDVVVLDASHAIRSLARMDPTVELVNSFSVDPIKTFGAVKVVQIVAGGGRDTTEKAVASNRREKSALSLEVIDLVRENWESTSGILVFTFKKRTLDIVDQLRRDLLHAGFDPSATGPEGKPRIQFLTWGEETSINGYEHCDVVIMAGVLQRSFLNIAASIRGQKGDRNAPTPNELIRRTIESEVAHLIYQGASRGSCRRIDNGKALPMKLYFVHRDIGIRTLLDQVMPGATWETRSPKHLKEANATGVVLELATRLLDYLRALPEEVEKVSSRTVKDDLRLAEDEGTKKAFTRAVEVVTEYRNHGWDTEGRSLVRMNFAYHFGDDPV